MGGEGRGRLAWPLPSRRVSLLCIGFGPRAQRIVTRNRCRLLPAPRGKRPELPEEGGKGLQGNCINQQATWSLWEGLLERAKLHHLTHGAPGGKQKNDQVTLWSLQPPLASAVGLISGVPWLSLSAPLKPLTSPTAAPRSPLPLSNPRGLRPRWRPRLPPYPTLAKGKKVRASGSFILSLLPV